MTAELVKMPEPNQRPLKPRLEAIGVTHIVEVWKMFDRFQRDSGASHPSLEDETGETMRMHLYNMISSGTGVSGVIAKINKKPVGMILGNLQARPFGRPKVYFNVWASYVEPESRKRGLMKVLVNGLSEMLRKVGCNHWEMSMPHGKAPSIEGLDCKELAMRVGGKV